MISPRAPVSPRAYGSPRASGSPRAYGSPRASGSRKPSRKNRKCFHAQVWYQCTKCGGCNICPLHGQRKTRCLECWKAGGSPSELCPDHGRRIGACGPCIRAGVQKAFKRAVRKKKGCQKMMLCLWSIMLSHLLNSLSYYFYILIFYCINQTWCR